MGNEKDEQRSAGAGVVLSVDAIRKRQGSLAEKRKLLEELNLQENVADNFSRNLTNETDWKRKLFQHFERCNANDCGLNFLTYGINADGEIIKLRKSDKDDDKCNHLSRELSAEIYNNLTLEMQALLPNKCLAPKIFEKDLMFSSMTPEQRADYEKRKNEFLERTKESRGIKKADIVHSEKPENPLRLNDDVVLGYNSMVSE